MLDARPRTILLTVLPTVLLTVVAALCLTACTATQPAPLAVSRSSNPPPPPPPPSVSATATTTSSAAPVAPAGKVVVIDPGHNGGNASHPAQINALVPAGRGETKPCNTTGTSTNSGYTEHAFNWDVATRVRADLLAKGYRVIMTRSDDTGVGPCVNERAAIGNNAQAAAVVSIHADGSDSAGARGFDVEYSNPPLNPAQGAPSVTLATTLRNTMAAAGFPVANYLGHDGLFPRADLAGLNLSDRPAALVECGNMRNATDAALLESPSGRQRYADAIAAAIEQYLAT